MLRLEFEPYTSRQSPSDLSLMSWIIFFFEVTREPENAATRVRGSGREVSTRFDGEDARFGHTAERRDARLLR